MGVLLPSFWGDLSHLTAGWTCWCNTHITAGCHFSTSSPVTQPSCALSEDTPCLTPQPAPGADCGRTRRKTFFWFSLNVHVATSRIRHRNPRYWTWVQWSAGVHGHLLLLQRSVPSRPVPSVIVLWTSSEGPARSSQHTLTQLRWSSPSCSPGTPRKLRTTKGEFNSGESLT